MRFRDRDLIKVITGMRRCGKSTLLEMMRRHLVSSGIPEENTISFNMESMEFSDIADYRELYALIRRRVDPDIHTYLFFDELQGIDQWEKAINALRADFDCDIYITGSNAYLLSSEISTLLSGRYVEIEMLPLTFSEYVAFRTSRDLGSEQASHPSAPSDPSMRAGDPCTERLFEDYRRFGGLPFLAFSVPDAQEHRVYLRSLHETVIVRDILSRERRRGRRTITNPALLRRICSFMVDNIGNECSANSIANFLKSHGTTARSETVDAYMSALADAYLFYRAPRFDIKGKQVLKTNAKYYVSDLGFRAYLEGYRDTDFGATLENIVFLHLLYLGYDVSVGKLRGGEVDFVATRADETLYFQVTERMGSDAAMARELRPLRAVPDNYPKFVLYKDGHYPADVDGIKFVNIVDWLLGAT